MVIHFVRTVSAQDKDTRKLSNMKNCVSALTKIETRDIGIG